MKAKTIALGAFLGVASSLYAHTPRHYAFMHQDICRKGGERHAAAAVAIIAQEHGLEARILLFKEKGKPAHAVPVIKYKRNWYAFNSKFLNGNYIFTDMRIASTTRQEPGRYGQIGDINNQLAMLFNAYDSEKLDYHRRRLEELIPGWQEKYTRHDFHKR